MNSDLPVIYWLTFALAGAMVIAYLAFSYGYHRGWTDALDKIAKADAQDRKRFHP